MQLTLTEAAQYLGKSSRQLRYLMKAGQVKARKVEGRWVFEESELPLSDRQRQARARKSTELAAAVEDALGPQLRPPGKRGYSVTDLVAFRHGLAAIRSAVQLGDQAAAVIAVTALRQSLIALAQACHRFHQREKAEAFGAAREHAAEAVALLHIESSDAARVIADAIEHDYLGALVGLVRREEKRGHP